VNLLAVPLLPPSAQLAPAPRLGRLLLCLLLGMAKALGAWLAGAVPAKARQMNQSASHTGGHLHQEALEALLADAVAVKARQMNQSASHTGGHLRQVPHPTKRAKAWGARLRS